MSAELYTECSEQTARMRMTHERRAAECNEHTARTRVARARMTLAPEIPTFHGLNVTRYEKIDHLCSNMILH